MPACRFLNLRLAAGPIDYDPVNVICFARQTGQQLGLRKIMEPAFYLARCVTRCEDANFAPDGVIGFCSVKINGIGMIIRKLFVANISVVVVSKMVEVAVTVEISVGECASNFCIIPRPLRVSKPSRI